MDTRQNLSEEMGQLRKNILEMSTMVEEDIGKTLAAIRKGDVDMARQVQDDASRVDEMQVEIEDEAAIVIATQQPVARDLREMVTIYKVVSNLERIGDHTVHLAKTVSKLSRDPSFRSMERVERMAETGQKMLRSSIAAYLNQDANLAREVAAMDDKIDIEHKALINEVLSLMKGHPGLIKKANRLLNISSDLERMGDHITNICEAIIYMVESTHEELNY